MEYKARSCTNNAAYDISRIVVQQKWKIYAPTKKVNTQAALINAPLEMQAINKKNSSKVQRNKTMQQSDT